MTPSTFAVAAAWSYGLALAGYAIFAARIAIGSKGAPRARLLLLALCATAAWAAACLALADPRPAGVIASRGAEAFRYGAWFLFLWHLLGPPDRGAARITASTRNAFIAIGAVLAASLFIGEGFAVQPGDERWGPRAGLALRLGLAVFGLMLVEQVIRRVQPQMRWSIKPLVIGLTGVFGLDLYMYADAMLYGRIDPNIWLARGFANVIVIPFLAVATARNTGWIIDLHLSRGAVFHSSALLLSGAFLLLVAGAGYLVRYFGGDWGRALQIEVLFASLLFGVLVATSGRFRSRLKVFISKHFFSYRYDYRQEWLRFTRTLSIESDVSGLQARTIAALANLVESPGGALWLRDDAGAFPLVARWNVRVNDATEPMDSGLVKFLEKTGWIIDLPDHARDPSRYENIELPDWIAHIPSARLVIPLSIGTELLGFVVLTTPRAEIDLDWEVRDLLKTASRQAASYLSQAKATEALLEARKFAAFNRMSAFVVHDLKNLVSQLSLMLKNAERHRENPVFQVDMLKTVEHVVGRMNALMLQLRAGADPVEKPRNVDVSAVLRRVCDAKSDRRIAVELRCAGPVIIVGHEDRLEHVIGHLLQNAVDASVPGGSVGVSLDADGRYATLTVVDSGAGMTPDFVRERLFKPFETTKASGMGIGAYESQQYISGLGGQIRVDSEPGSGTCVEVRLPQSAASSDARSLRESVA